MDWASWGSVRDGRAQPKKDPLTGETVDLKSLFSSERWRVYQRIKSAPEDLRKGPIIRRPSGRPPLGPVPPHSVAGGHPRTRPLANSAPSDAGEQQTLDATPAARGVGARSAGVASRSPAPRLSALSYTDRRYLTQSATLQDRSRKNPFDHHSDRARGRSSGPNISADAAGGGLGAIEHVPPLRAWSPFLSGAAPARGEDADLSFLSARGRRSASRSPRTPRSVGRVFEDHGALPQESLRMWSKCVGRFSALRQQILQAWKSQRDIQAELKVCRGELGALEGGLKKGKKVLVKLSPRGDLHQVIVL